MNNYESKELRRMPFPKPLKEMTDEELAKLLTSKSNYNILIPALIDIVNITLHFFLKDVRPILPPAMNHSIAVS